MNLQRGLVFALAASLVIGGCAPAGETAAAPGGVRPTETAQTRAAKLFLAQAEGATGEQQEGFYRRALEQSLEGVEATPRNPQTYYLAGLSYAGLGDAEGADTMFVRATEIYPAYAAEVDAAREQAWVGFFNDAVVAYNEGNMDRATELWQQANRIYDKRPEAYFNLAALYTQQGQYDRAIEMYRESLQALDREPARELTPEEVEERAESRQAAMTTLGQLLMTAERFGEAEQLYRDYLAEHPDDVAVQSNLAVILARQGRQTEAMQMYERLLAAPDADANALFNVGVGLFQINEHARAADAFRRVTEMNPNNRDAWYNLANALYAQDQWQELIPIGERLVELDPLNENASLILARAYRDTRRNQDALRVLQRLEQLPVTLDNLQLRTTEGRSTLRGTVEPKAAGAGTPVRLRFTFFGNGQELGTQTVTVTAPPQGSTGSFEAVLESPTPATGYRYEVVQ